MDISKVVYIKSKSEYVYKALLDPAQIKDWWECDSVIEAVPNGVWALGWNPGSENYGHETTMVGFFNEVETDQRISIFIDPITMVFDFESIHKGTRLTVSQLDYPNENEAEDAIETWINAINALKSYIENKFPLRLSGKTKDYKPESRQEGSGAKQTVNVNESIGSSFSSYPGIEKSAENKLNNLAKQIAVENKKAAHKSLINKNGDIKILDKGGYEITEPWGTIKSWKKEHGFGYIDHPELGDVMFDYDGCDFEPEPGDKVVLLRLKKTWNGKPKCKRLACPDKGSNATK
jgi:uncharacterized protein YndB with AHSA1/START domain